MQVRSTDMMASSSARTSERARLELAIYDACVRSPEGVDLLITAFIQALRSYRRSSGEALDFKIEEISRIAYVVVAACFLKDLKIKHEVQF